jgi:anti-sigma factor RsiW
MSHLDEGTLHALLDGELELDEVREIQQHLGTCAACGARLQDVKQFLAEADRLVGALEVPAGKHAEAGSPTSQDLPPRRGPTHEAPPLREPPSWDEPPPVLLLPDQQEGEARRGSWTRRLRLVAMIVVIVIGGRMISNALRPGKPELQLPARSPASQSATPPAAVSPREMVRPETPAPVVANKQARPAAPTRSEARKPGAEPKALADQMATDSVASQIDSGDRFDSAAAAVAAAVAGEDTVPAGGGVVVAAAPEGDETAGRTAQETREEAGQTREDADLETRRAAAAALAELDRQRIRDRANAATAALPTARAETTLAADPPPPPRTPEQRAQIYLRIGLDEAVRQLGQPVHVIEGMSPQFIGLTQGRNVPGADAGRPVVRVVYVDVRGRMILLDQQRLRGGQAPSTGGGSLRWTLGDVLLYLHGEPGPEVLTNLQRRVR